MIRPSSYYCVVEYWPDTLAGERVNIGIVAFNTKLRRAVSRFLKDWSRVERFALGQDIAFLREFVAREQPRLTISRIKKMRGWSNAIQLTRPRHGFGTPSQLLRELAPLFLVSDRNASGSGPARVK